MGPTIIRACICPLNQDNKNTATIVLHMKITYKHLKIELFLRYFFINLFRGEVNHVLLIVTVQNLMLIFAIFEFNT